jgi:hypothetical protein
MSISKFPIFIVDAGGGDLSPYGSVADADLDLEAIEVRNECWTKELGSPLLGAEQRRGLQQRQRLCQNVVSHRFRKWGIILSLLGGLLLATGGILHVFR